MIVMVNGTVVAILGNSYTIMNVTSDIVIIVSGINLKEYIVTDIKDEHCFVNVDKSVQHGSTLQYTSFIVVE